MSVIDFAAPAPLSPGVFLSVFNAMWLALNVWSLTQTRTDDVVSVLARRRSVCGVAVAVGIEIFALYPIWREAALPVRMAGLLLAITTLGVGMTGWVFNQWRVVRLVASPQTEPMTCGGTSEIDCIP